MIKKLPLLMLASTITHGAAQKDGYESEDITVKAKKFIDSRFFGDDDTDSVPASPKPSQAKREIPVKFYMLDDVRDPKVISDTIYMLQAREGNLLWRFEYDIASCRARINGFTK